jgi:pilus assembly protein CpaE
VRGRRRKARTIAFIGGKGGVGTTTVALNVGTALAAEKRKTVIAELRGYHGTLAHNLKRVSVHGNLSALLGLSPEAINEVEINARLARYSSELSLLCGPQRAAEARPCTASHVRSVIGGLKSMAEFLVLDLPGEPSESNREAVRNADFIGLVVDREETCVAAAHLMVDHLRSWGTEALIGLVVVHRLPLACPVELETLQRELRLEPMALIPPAADSCVMAASAGVPLIEAYSETLVSASLRELAAKLSADPIVIRRTA